MAICLNYEFDIVDIKNTRYSPEIWFNKELLQEKLLIELDYVLQGKAPIVVTNYPAVETETTEKAKNIITNLDEVLKGEREIAIVDNTEKKS